MSAWEWIGVAIGVIGALAIISIVGWFVTWILIGAQGHVAAAYERRRRVFPEDVDLDDPTQGFGTERES